VTASTFTGNIAVEGGGIRNIGTLTVGDSTFSGNHATYYGGGIEGSGWVQVTNSTFSGNIADIYGGGIHNRGTLTLTNSTFSGDRAVAYWGAGLFSLGTLDYYNNIIANSAYGVDCYSSGTVAANVNNLVENGPTCGATFSGDPNLDPLADNGGPTQTFALQPGSPAIDAGNDTYCPATDQRGEARPSGRGYDIGAYEKQWPDLEVAKVNDTSGVGAVSIPFNWTVTISNTDTRDATFTNGQTIVRSLGQP
jgi:predicted outer membrane repeat protein